MTESTPANAERYNDESAAWDWAGAQTIPHVVQAAATVRGDHPAVVEAGRSMSYRELAEQMRHAAAGFVAAGLEPGDRVAIWAHNGIDWIVACLGAQAAGGVVVPVNTRFKAQEASYAINRSRARVLVHSRMFLGIDFREMLASVETPALERCVALPTDEAGSLEWEHFLAAGRANPAALAEAERRLAALSPLDLSDIMYTSGTTGAPKGVMTAHGQNVAVYREWARAVTLGAEDRFAVIWPFFHCSGYKSGWLASLIAGSTLYPLTTFETGSLLRLIAREKITVLPGPPNFFEALLATPEARDGSLASLRATVTGAAMVAPSLIERIREELGLEGIFAGYGLTESCGTVTMTGAQDSAEIVVNSCGKAIGGTEVAIMDEAGTVLAAGEEGEVATRGINVMRGYFEDPEATREAIKSDGWLLTGDYGRLDGHGYLTITGRKKDVFIVGGFNCYPAEIEDMMQRHPAIAEAAVIGVPDDRLGEVGKAFVVLKPGHAASGEDIVKWCRETMANFKVPRSVVKVDALPRTATGKVQKFRLESGDIDA